MERYGAGASSQIALTFDDGPDPVATSKILDVLKAHDAPATFFVVGRASLSSPELLQRAVDEGHTVGSHSFNHPHMEDLSPFLARAELSANRSLIEGVIGRSPLLYRPPYVRGPGPINEHEAIVFSILEEEGYFVTGSDIVPEDWAGITAEEIVRQVFDELQKTGGNVIVLHDGKSAGMHTAEAVDLLIPELRARGYEDCLAPGVARHDSASRHAAGRTGGLGIQGSFGRGDWPWHLDSGGHVLGLCLCECLPFGAAAFPGVTPRPDLPEDVCRTSLGDGRGSGLQ
ncbi:MAG: polysaccharide deacetylase family protein [Rhodobacter sp.]|nr:polysaccharide deacetylase family protein [Rhodobacter sp.]